MKMGIEGFYKLTVRRSDGTVRLVREFKNLITDPGLNQWGTMRPFSYFQVGTGTTAPDVTQTAMVARVGNGASSSVGTPTYMPDPDNPYVEFVYSGRFNPNFAGGNVNISEIGLTSGANNSNLWSRALILDGTGSPTIITVLASEYLDVVYVLRVYPPTTDSVGQFIFNDKGTPIECTYIMRASSIQSWNVTALDSAFNYNATVSLYNGAIGSITQDPSGTGVSSSGVTTDTYINNSLSKSGRVLVPITIGNTLSGITSIRFSTGVGAGFYFQTQFTPSLPKTADDTLSIAFSLSWGRR